MSCPIIGRMYGTGQDFFFFNFLWLLSFIGFLFLERRCKGSANFRHERPQNRGRSPLPWTGRHSKRCPYWRRKPVTRATGFLADAPDGRHRCPSIGRTWAGVRNWYLVIIIIFERSIVSTWNERRKHIHVRIQCGRNRQSKEQASSGGALARTKGHKERGKAPSKYSVSRKWRSNYLEINTTSTGKDTCVYGDRYND